MATDFGVLTDYQNRAARLTQERWMHVLEHPEMIDQYGRIAETLAAPHLVIATARDKTVHTYHRLYERTPVSCKYLVVAVKLLEGDAFMLTAYFTSKVKKGDVIWPP
ncbi:MAG: hypothetical protein ACUVWR_19080 [Anaerolineae bacterium]